MVPIEKAPDKFLEEILPLQVRVKPPVNLAGAATGRAGADEATVHQTSAVDTGAGIHVAPSSETQAVVKLTNSAVSVAAEVAASAAAAAAVQPTPSPSPRHSLHPNTILVVDDAPSNRKMLVRLMTNKGYVCVQAEDGQQAIEKYSDLVKSGQLLAISMDSEMPVMNGPTAAKKLREMGCIVPIIAVTGNMLAADVDHFKKQGANAVLGKPLDIAAFEALLKTF